MLKLPLVKLLNEVIKLGMLEVIKVISSLQLMGRRVAVVMLKVIKCPQNQQFALQQAYT